MYGKSHTALLVLSSVEAVLPARQCVRGPRQEAVQNMAQFLHTAQHGVFASVPRIDHLFGRRGDKVGGVREAPRPGSRPQNAEFEAHHSHSAAAKPNRGLAETLHVYREV